MGKRVQNGLPHRLQQRVVVFYHLCREEGKFLRSHEHSSHSLLEGSLFIRLLLFFQGLSEMTLPLGSPPDCHPFPPYQV